MIFFNKLKFIGDVILCNNNYILRCQKFNYIRLAEVGKLETPKLDGKYETGQLFLHRVFGYRGVTLFPWVARVYDRDGPNKRNSKIIDDIGVGFNDVGKEVKGHTHTYYQVLVDFRDSPYVRSQTEAVTFLAHNENSKQLYAIPGLDYVAHNDILPYINTDEKPIQNDLFDKFLTPDSKSSSSFKAKDTLMAWQKKNHPWLELTEVHKETTNNIRITVMPFYIGCKNTQPSPLYWWRYSVRLENLGELAVQLRERHWRIFCLDEFMETVRGRGVVAQEPILSKAQPAFQYSSHVSLQKPSGYMWGTFKMEREDGEVFECRIPPFNLDGRKNINQSPNSNS